MKVFIFILLLVLMVLVFVSDENFVKVLLFNMVDVVYICNFDVFFVVVKG